MTRTTLRLDLIRIDPATQMRAAGTSETRVAQYEAALRAGEWEWDRARVVVFFDGQDYWLADGHHTVPAAGRAGLAEIPVDVHSGSLRDAMLFAAGANEAHGRGRSVPDQIHAVETLLADPEWGKMGDEWIAKKARVSLGRVADVRTRVEDRNRKAAQSAAQAVAPAAQHSQSAPITTARAPAARPTAHESSVRSKRDEYAEVLDEIARDLIARTNRNDQRNGVLLQRVRAWLLSQ